jgi:glycosyltransferase involved in cell wall biosynthesis
MLSVKILILNWRDLKNPEAGGAELHIHEIASRWAGLGHDVTLFCSSFRGAPRQEIVNGVNIYRAAGKYRIYAACVSKLLSIRKSGEFDVIFESINTIPFFSPLFSKCPVVSQIYSIGNKSVLFHEMKWYMFPMAAMAYAISSTIPMVYRKCQITTISQSSKEALVRQGFDGNKVHVAYPGISQDWIKLVDTFDSEDERPDPTIIYLGRLKKYKGVQDILYAIPAIARDLPGIKLRIVGRGDFERTLHEIVQSLQIHEKVEFCGFVSEERKAEMLRSASIYVCTSLDEGGWTIAAVEALSAGVPVIVTESQKDIVNHGRNGVLLTRATPQAIARNVIDMLSVKSVWKTYSANSKSFSKQFTWENTAKVTLSVLNDAFICLDSNIALDK